MQCPHCLTEVDLETFTVETDAEEDGVEVTFFCEGCKENFYSVLKSENFAQVD